MPQPAAHANLRTGARPAYSRHSDQDWPGVSRIDPYRRSNRVTATDEQPGYTGPGHVTAVF